MQATSEAPDEEMLDYDSDATEDPDDQDQETTQDPMDLQDALEPIVCPCQHVSLTGGEFEPMDAKWFTLNMFRKKKEDEDMCWFEKCLKCSKSFYGDEHRLLNLTDEQRSIGTYKPKGYGVGAAWVCKQALTLAKDTGTQACTSSSSYCGPCMAAIKKETAKQHSSKRPAETRPRSKRPKY